jgi:hypothetical protein
MKSRLLLSVVAGGLIVASLVLLSTSTAQAQCGGPNDPPCEPGGEGEKEKEKKPTAIPPTDTPVPTNTPPACTERAWYRDADADTYGVPGLPVYACSAPAGYAALSLDCNDANAAIRPGATDICGDGIDQDCDALDAVCAVAAPGSASEACVGPGCPPGAPAGLFPWILVGGGLTGILIGLLVGILIGLLLPFKLGSYVGLAKTRAPASEASPVSPLRTLVSSQAMFYQGDVDGEGDYDYSTGTKKIDPPVVRGAEVDLQKDRHSEADSDSDSSTTDDDPKGKPDQDD